jgi:hypothetical protein
MSNKVIGFFIVLLTIGMALLIYHFPCVPTHGSCAHGQYQNVEFTLFASLFTFFGLHVYMVPTIVANIRRNPFAAPIF